MNHVTKDCYHKCERCPHNAHNRKDYMYKERDDTHYVEKNERKAYDIEKDDK